MAGVGQAAGAKLDSCSYNTLLFEPSRSPIGSPPYFWAMYVPCSTSSFLLRADLQKQTLHNDCHVAALGATCRVSRYLLLLKKT